MKLVRLLSLVVVSLWVTSLAAQNCSWSTIYTGKIVENCGWVAIGTTNDPDRNLQVVTNGTAGQGIEVTNGTGSTRKEVAITLDGSAGYIDAYNFAAGGYPLQIQVNGGNTVLNPNGGKVGIGTTAPWGKLTNYNNNVVDVSGIGETGVSDFVWSTSSQGYVAAIENRDTTAFARNGLLLRTAANDTGSYIAKFESAGVNRMSVRADGNVGIGTTAPDRDLQVITGGTSGRGVEVATTSGTTRKEVLLSVDNNFAYLDSYSFPSAANPLKIQVNGGNTLLNTGGGNVGIGTAAPGAKLTNWTNTFADASGAGETGQSDFIWSTSAQGYVAAIENRDSTANLRNGLLLRTAATDPGSYIAKLESGGVNRVAVRADGLVTINGSLTATGTIVGEVYQDVAEWVPATTKMDAGTVVVLNPEHNNEVKPSEEPYDTRVAGVVSAKPGLLLGQGGETQAMIATTGRVRVHVDATKHPIHIGDLLVTGVTIGMAMVSEPMEIKGRKFHQPGTVIGKALEPLAGGRGDILVLLSLQ